MVGGEKGEEEDRTGKGEGRKEGERRRGKIEGRNLPVALTRSVLLAAIGKCFFKIVFV